MHFNFLVGSIALVVALGHAALGNVWWATGLGVVTVANWMFVFYENR